MRTRLAPLAPSRSPQPPLCPQGSGADEVGSGEVGPGPGDPPLDRAQICSLCEFAIYDNDAPGDWWSQKDYRNCAVLPNCVKAMIRACLQGANSSLFLPPGACAKAAQVTAFFGWVAPELNGFDFNQLAGCAPRPRPSPAVAPLPAGKPFTLQRLCGRCNAHSSPTARRQAKPSTLPCCAFFTCVAPCIAGAPSGLVT